MFFNKRLAVFEDEDFVALVVELINHVVRQRILRNLHDGIRALAIGEVFHQVVVGDTCGDDSELFLRAVEILVVARRFRGFGELGLLVDEVAVEALGVSRQQHERLGVGRLGEFVLRTHGLAHHTSAAVGQAGRDAVEHRRTELLAELEAVVHHVIGLLLVGRFQHGNHGPVAIVAAVLFVLRREHARVVGHHDEDALRADDGSVHEGVAAHVEAHVLHAGHGALAGVGHADGGLKGRLLVGAPVGDHAEFLGLFRVDDILCDLG